MRLQTLLDPVTYDSVTLSNMALSCVYKANSKGAIVLNMPKTVLTFRIYCHFGPNDENSLSVCFGSHNRRD